MRCQQHESKHKSYDAYQTITALSFSNEYPSYHLPAMASRRTGGTNTNVFVATANSSCSCLYHSGHGGAVVSTSTPPLVQATQASMPLQLSLAICAHAHVILSSQFNTVCSDFRGVFFVVEECSLACRVGFRALFQWNGSSRKESKADALLWASLHVSLCIVKEAWSACHSVFCDKEPRTLWNVTASCPMGWQTSQEEIGSLQDSLKRTIQSNPHMQTHLKWTFL